MRVLLDECVDERLRHVFHEHDCQIARYAGFAGLKNDRLVQPLHAPMCIRPGQVVSVSE